MGGDDRSVSSTGADSRRSVTGQSRHARRHRSSHYKRRALILGFLLGMSLFALFAVSLMMVVQVAKLSNSNSMLRQGLAKSEGELEQTRNRLAEAEQDLAAVISGRFPNLMPLEPDKVFEVKQHYVKNIVFTVLKKDNEKMYEYKLVLENRYDYPVYPDLRLLVFDKLGIQMGVDDILDDQELAPGESRSFSQTIDVFMNSDPSYFALDFKSRDDRSESSTVESGAVYRPGSRS